MLTRLERALTDAERTEISDRLARARAESSAAMLKSGAVSTVICGVLGVLTVLASTAPRWVIASFWSAMALLFTFWVGGPWRRLMRQQIPVLEDALRANRARVIRIQSSRVVEFEEFEDEGACYAFDHAGATLFLVGQEFYEDDDFPNTDFSIVEVLGSEGRPIDFLITKTGVKLRPERVVPASVKDTIDVPEHLAIVATPLDSVEAALQRRSPSA